MPFSPASPSARSRAPSSVSRRWGVALTCAVGASLAAAALALVDEGEMRDLALPVRAVEQARAEAEAAPPRETAATPLALARAPMAVDPVADLFATPAPPPPPALPPSAASAARVRPQPPPFAYTYVGRIEEDGVTRVLLGRGDELVIVRPGERIDPAYRLDRVDDDSITVSHAATRTKRKLALDALVAQQAPQAARFKRGGGASAPSYALPPVDPVAPVAPMPEMAAPPPPPEPAPGAGTAGYGSSPFPAASPSLFAGGESDGNAPAGITPPAMGAPNLAR